jgi:2-polyprenyl-3-methyl-5-hydroxy-6-metoxy-1,4-benzoquinol methylase
MPGNGIDPAKADAFANRLIDLINNGSLTLMISIGHRTGLFDTMSQMPPSTSVEIASEAGLSERYVREWLGAMVTGRIVDYDPKNGTYDLPSEHATYLTRAATPDNIAVFAQYIPLLGTVEDKIVDCFRKGGGVPYSEFKRFHEVMAEDSGQTVVSSLLDSILPLSPGLVEELKKGIEVLDVGCGSGRAINLMAQAYPNSNFSGYDLSEEGIAAGRAEAEKLGLSNVRFEARDVTALDYLEQFDLITAFDAIHDQAKPADVLKGISGALRQDGTFLMQDIAASSYLHENLDHRIGPFLYTISCMHCMTVSLAQGGDGLGTVWGEERAKEMLRDAGFSRIEVKRLSHDFQNSFYINRK